jgi:hypothetical protein
VIRIITPEPDIVNGLLITSEADWKAIEVEETPSASTTEATIHKVRAVRLALKANDKDPLSLESVIKEILKEAVVEEGAMAVDSERV